MVPSKLSIYRMMPTNKKDFSSSCLLRETVHGRFFTKTKDIFPILTKIKSYQRFKKIPDLNRNLNNGSQLLGIVYSLIFNRIEKINQDSKVKNIIALYEN